MYSNPRSRWCVWTGAVRIQGINPEDIAPTPEHWGRYLVRRLDRRVRDQGRRVHGCAGRGGQVSMMDAGQQGKGGERKQEQA